MWCSLNTLIKHSTEGKKHVVWTCVYVQYTYTCTLFYVSRLGSLGNKNKWRRSCFLFVVSGLILHLHKKLPSFPLSLSQSFYSLCVKGRSFAFSVGFFTSSCFIDISHVICKNCVAKSLADQFLTIFTDLTCKIWHVLWTNSINYNACCLKGPKHGQVEGEFFYIKQTRMVRWLRDWRKKLILFTIGADIRHFVFLANAEHTLQIM
jgi:hypothetical protein